MYVNKFFALLVTKNSDIFLRKFTKDKSIYYDVPESLSQLDQHPHILNSSYFTSFEKEFNAKINKSERSFFRHVTFTIKDAKGNFTEPARVYLNQKEEFEINGQLLKSSPKYLSNLTKSIDEEEKDQNISLNQILKECSKIIDFFFLILILNS